MPRGKLQVNLMETNITKKQKKTLRLLLQELYDYERLGRNERRPCDVRGEGHSSEILRTKIENVRYE